MSTFAERAALHILRSNGIEAIWKIHIAAGHADRIGRRGDAESLIEIADAAEEICRRHAMHLEEHLGA